ncbi:DNA alkylation repair protein [Alicyclobacillus dauci]|uniref:DNA alkylation repair protein n=1 Tax=Alicyclobacillus dauci TaxID=1475485 RepID=A0ABY6Z4K8_9BACL|nr:DNA alkylation repair protein [Alicyclobacillus dauci]WAH37251.1 DNA alkylation repair protein [Alicyclobacillus dauci]
MSDWKQSFLESIQQGVVEGVVKALDSQSTTHAGTAPSKIKNDAIKLLRKTNSDTLYPLILQLCGHENPTAQEVGAICLTDFYRSQSSEVNRVLYRLADSDNWEVREWVASACGLVLEKHFHDYFPVMAEWSRDVSENIRRAVVLAMMYAGKSRNPEFIDPFLDIIEPLLSDRSRYVRDNLGPFAIGNALIKYYPTQVLKRLDTWVNDEDEQVRWNIAMIFSAAEGAKFAHESQQVFDILSSDERPYVKKAVSKAIKNINKRTTGS